MPDDILYPGGLVPGRFGFLDLNRNPRADHRVLGVLDGGQHLVVQDSQRDSHMYVCGATGKGKTRFLASLLMQDLHYGRPVCVLDPGGQLYDYARAYVARCRKQLLRHDPPLPRAEVDRIMSRYLFLNVSDPKNPIRLNPLVVQPPETASDTLEDFMRTVERLTGRNFMEQRKIREVLRSAFRIVIEINQLPESARPQKPFGYNYPLGLAFVHRFIEAKDEDERQRIVSALKETEDNTVSRRYWLFTFPELAPQQKNDAVGSSRRILDFFIDVGCVGKHFFTTAENTLDVAAMLRDNTSLFTNLREGTTREGVGLVGTFLANKIERAASRRGERKGIDWKVPYTLYLDEFQRFCDPALAEDFTQVRKLGLRIVCAHQNTVQEPFDDDRGRSMLTTIVSMCQIRAVFGIDSLSADRLVDELLPVTHDVAKRTETETRMTTGTSHAVSEGSSDSRSESNANASQESTTFGRTDSRNFTYPFMGAVYDHRTSGDASSYQRLNGHSHSNTSGKAHQDTHGETRTTQRSETFIERIVYASGGEERQMNRQEFQSLRRRECFIGREGPNAIKITAVFMPGVGEICPSSSFDHVARLMEDQNDRIDLHLPTSPLPEDEPSKEQEAAKSSQLKLPLGDEDPSDPNPGGPSDVGFGR